MWWVVTPKAPGRQPFDAAKVMGGAGLEPATLGGDPYALPTELPAREERRIVPGVRGELPAADPVLSWCSPGHEKTRSRVMTKASSASRKRVEIFDALAFIIMLSN